MNQTITSATTSINSKKVPAVFNRVKDWQPGQVNVDLGGGKYDTATEYLWKTYGVHNVIIDPYNRTPEWNEAARSLARNAGSATISNVLNVIPELDVRLDVLRQAHELVAPGAPVYITVYEGDGSGTGRQTGTDSWQENRKLRDYLEEVREIFPAAELKGGMIIARKEA